MSYFKAVEIKKKPYIQWMYWAKDLEELTELGEFKNPLIVLESTILPYEFGVYPEKIVGGFLVPRTVPEMETFEAEFQTRETIDENKGKMLDINTGWFGFSGNAFPMHEAARLRYMAVALDPTALDTAFMNVEGVGILITEANLPAFFLAYHKQLQAYTNTVVS